MKFFTADYHFYHENIIKYCNRPYKNADHMNKTLVNNHNAVIGDDDDVYIVGDFAMLSKRYKDNFIWVVQKLRGRLHLVMGNHDIKDPWFYIDKLGFYSVHAPYLEVEEFICVHDPALSAVNRQAKFLCGHIHDLFTIRKNCLNVGVDVHNYFPISIDRVRQIFNENPIKEYNNERDSEFFKRSRRERKEKKV